MIFAMDLAEIRKLEVLDREQTEMLKQTTETPNEARCLMAELLALFEDEATPRVEAIASMEVGAIPISDLMRHFHALAGTSSNIGSLRFARICRTLEETLPQEGEKLAIELARLVSAEYKIFRQAMREEIAGW